MNLSVINNFDNVQILKSVTYLANNVHKLIDPLKRNILFLSSEWHCSKIALRISSEDKFDEIVILANTLEEKDFFEQNTHREVLLCNNNAFINEDIFKPFDAPVKIYDMSVNSRFVRKKNTCIAKLVDNVVHMGYYAEKTDFHHIFPPFGQYVNFSDTTSSGTYSFSPNDFRFLNGSVVNEYNNKSITGGIFTSVEGACRSSSEYLLAGIPVVSTVSLGGRDIWYDRHNSLICDGTPESVAECVNIFKSNPVDPYEIRFNHINLSNSHRNTLVNRIEEIVDVIDKDTLCKNLLHKDFSECFANNIPS